MSEDATGEAARVIERYAQRRDGDRYSMLRPEVWQSVHERQRAMLRLLAGLKLPRPADARLLEVGCGSGANLLELLRIGFSPEYLMGIELLPERVAQARARLPSALRILEGDASRTSIPAASQDIVFQSVVFSSLLDDTFQQRLAELMWFWAKPGGGILWYDFIFNNPGNPDVRGVPRSRLRELFPEGAITTRRITLAPPISRRVCRIHPGAYTLFNAVPLLRTHVLAWIGKS